MRTSQGEKKMLPKPTKSSFLQMFPNTICRKGFSPLTPQCSRGRRLPRAGQSRGTDLARGRGEQTPRPRADGWMPAAVPGGVRGPELNALGASWALSPFQLLKTEHGRIFCGAPDYPRNSPASKGHCSALPKGPCCHGSGSLAGGPLSPEPEPIPDRGYMGDSTGRCYRMPENPDSSRQSDDVSLRGLLFKH